MGKLTAEAPSTRFSFQNMRTADIVKGLKEHSIDFGILRKSAVVAPLKFHSIGQIGYALFAPAAWAKEKENATTLLSQRPVAVSAGGEFNKRFQECCEKAKLTPNLRFSCASFTQVAELVRSRPCRRAPTGNGRAQSPGIGRETVRLCAYAHLPPRDRYRLASAACFHPAAIGICSGRA